MASWNKKQICSLVTGCVGLLLTIAALVMAFYGFPTIIESELRKNIVLEEGSDAWDRFVELPFPLQFKVHLFTITNEAAVLDGSEKPALKEIGPYVYKQFRKKENIKIEGDYVSYYQRQKYEFDRELTPKDLSNKDKIRTVNALQLGMFQVMEKSIVTPPFKIDEVLGEIFDDKNFVQEVEVEKLLFEGLDFCLPSRTRYSAKVACLFIMLLNIKMIDYKADGSMSYSVFGFKQNKTDGLYTVNRGTEDIKKVGSISKWEGLEYTSFWNQEKGKECDKVQGLDSTVYPPYIEEGDRFMVYATDICRAAYLSYAGHSSYRETDTYKFRMDQKTFYPKEGQTPEESCYCIKETKGLDGHPNCFLDGLMDVQSCLGIPAVISMPHFLHADKKYVNLVSGLKPDSKTHESEMGIQPYTGFPTNGFKKAQISLILRSANIIDQNVTTIEKVKPAVLPILWIEEGLEMNDEYYGILESNLSLINGVTIGQWVFVGVAILLFVVPSGLFIFFRMKKK